MTTTTATVATATARFVTFLGGTAHHCQVRAVIRPSLAPDVVRLYPRPGPGGEGLIALYRQALAHAVDAAGCPVPDGLVELHFTGHHEAACRPQAKTAATLATAAAAGGMMLDPTAVFYLDAPVGWTCIDAMGPLPDGRVRCLPIPPRVEHGSRWVVAAGQDVTVAAGGRVDVVAVGSVAEAACATMIDPNGGF